MLQIGWIGHFAYEVLLSPFEGQSSAIRAVVRTASITAADGVIALAQRIWPALEHIDRSSGALGNAVRRTLEDLLPILIEAQADEKTRAKWLEQLREAI